MVVRNSTVKGEYLAWYCENVTFEHCKIIGTQPLCYCKGLRLVDCEMIDTDLSFEKSQVEATITTPRDQHQKIPCPAVSPYRPWANSSETTPTPWGRW